MEQLNLALFPRVTFAEHNVVYFEEKNRKKVVAECDSAALNGNAFAFVGI